MLERIITALILVAVVLSCMFATSSHYPMFVLMIIAAGIAGYEWLKLMPRKTERMLKPLAWCFGAVAAALSAFVLYCHDIMLLLWIASIFVSVVSIYWIETYPKHDGWYNPTLYFLGLILISAAVTAIFSIWQISPWLLMYLFLLVWGADSGAYFVGRKFGKKKLAPYVSPNKSMEGLYGGVVTAMLIVVVVSILYLDHLSLTNQIVFLALSVVTVFSSVLGDLFESMIKRRAGIKDSGRILPGHGGVLDRIDSLMTAAPVFAAGVYALKLVGVDL